MKFYTLPAFQNTRYFTVSRKDLVFMRATFEKQSLTKLLIMKKYYVNKRAQSNGDHEVHQEDCKYLPNIDNRLYLGQYTACDPAVKEAKKSYTQSNGCKTCSLPCHTT